MRKSSTTQRRKQLVSIMVVGILILVLAVAGIGIHIISKYIPSKEQMNLTEYYGQPAEGEMVLVLGTDIMEERALKSGDQIYLPQDIVSTYLNQRYYWDSGNQLRDPYNHRPVCILSKKVAAKILNPKKDRVHFIPYCSLGQKEGLLPVTEITCIKIQNGRHEVEIRPATVGIANEGLLEGKEYDMILHASMLECQERGTKHDHETCTAKI